MADSRVRVGIGGGDGDGGLSQSAVDSRVRTLVADWAEASDPTTIPVTKAPRFPAAWSATVTYPLGAYATRANKVYRSLVADNLNVEPEVTSGWGTSWELVFDGTVGEVDAGEGKVAIRLGQRTSQAIGNTSNSSIRFTWDSEAGLPATQYDELVVQIVAGSDKYLLEWSRPSELVTSSRHNTLTSEARQFVVAYLSHDTAAPRDLSLVARMASSASISSATVSLYGIRYQGRQGNPGLRGLPGPAGAAGSFERTLFKSYTTVLPTAPASSVLTNAGDIPGVPAGWSLTPAAGRRPIGATIQRVPRGSTSVTYTNTRRWDGLDGAQGAQAPYRLRLYLAAASKPPKPTALDYNFATQAFAVTPATWTLTTPEVASGQRLWAVEAPLDPETDVTGSIVAKLGNVFPVTGARGPAGLSGDGAPIAVADEGSALTAALRSLNFVGDAVTVSEGDDDGVLTVTIGGVGPTVPSTQHVLAISEDTSLSQTEFDAASTSQTGALVVPAYTSGRRYLFIGVRETENDISAIRTGGINVFHAFQRVSGTLTFGGVGYKFWRTTNDQSSAASGVTYNIELGG